MVKTKRKAKKKKPRLEVPYVIDRYLDRIEKVEICADTLLPVATKTEQRKIRELEKQLEELVRFVKIEKKEKIIIENERKFFSFIGKLEKFKSISQEEILINSLFLTLFSTFDAYIGDLLRCLYQNKKELINSIDYSLSTEEIMKCKSIEQLKKIIIERDLDKLRRESYHEQFKILENKFGVVLRKYQNWPSFVECSQRRNIITHCDGIVSEQYISVCKKEGYDFKNNIKIGDKLTVDSNYFHNSIFLFNEVGFKLGQVLWRKIFHDFLAEADIHMILYSYNLLHAEKWKLVKNIGEFGLNLPRMSNDENRKMLNVNYAQAFKWSGDNSRANKIIKKLDWSSCKDEFKLAVCIIKDDFKNARTHMISIGEKGKMIQKQDYHDWPLFREFRKSTEFLTTYNKIYKKDFGDEVKEQIKDEPKKKEDEKKKTNETIKKDTA